MIGGGRFIHPPAVQVSEDVCVCVHGWADVNEPTLTRRSKVGRSSIMDTDVYISYTYIQVKER